MHFHISNRKKTTLALFFGAVVFFVLPILVLAQGVDFGTDYLSSVGLGTQDIRTTIVNILRVVYGLLGVITLVLIVYAGFIWMTSQGRQDAIARAKKIIINAVIGLLIIVMAAAITEFIFNKIKEAQYGNGFSCNPYQCLSQCTACNAAGDGTAFDNTCYACSIGNPADFQLNEVQTAHSGTDPKEQVYACSSIQPRFNNLIQAASVAGNVEVVERNTANEVSGQWKTSSKTLKFIPDGNFSINSGYEIRFKSPGLEDLSGDQLAGCLGTVCETLPPPYFAWEFDTGAEVDNANPNIISAYPALPQESPYPNRTVARAPTIDVNFSESIDFFSIEDQANFDHPDPAKFVLEEISCPGNSLPCNPTGNIINNDNLIISDKTNGFRIKTSAGFLLDSFTWYQITVRDVVDLCGNMMDPNPVVWVFETNDSVPGITSVSPQDGSDSICPDAGVYFTFGTAMYDEMVVLGIDSGSGPEYISLQANELKTANSVAGLGKLEILDPGLPVDSKFRSFKFTPENSLNIGGIYKLTVDAPNFIIDSDGNALHYPQSPDTWSFSIADASACACEPYIYSLSPDSGPWGQCLTISGSCFSGTVGNPGSITNIEIGGISHTINGQGENYVATAIANSLTQDLNHLVDVTLTYNDPNFGSLKSNSAAFYVTGDSEFTGPCLYEISPIAACNDANINLRGDRFEDSGLVKFSLSGNVPAADISDWTDKKINFNIPSAWPQGFQNVSVSVSGVESNALPFEIACDLPPNVDADCGGGAAPPACGNQSACVGGTVCRLSDCTCQLPESFSVETVWPACDEACINSEIGARFSSEVDALTVNSNALDVLLCDDSNCNSFSDSADYNINTVNNEIQLTSVSLEPGSYYRVLIYDSVLGSNGLTIENLNYDSGKGKTDSYSWIFKTSAESCVLSGVETSPDVVDISGLNKSKDIFVKALSDQQCGLNKYIDPWNFDWNWSSANSSLAIVSSQDSDLDSDVDPEQTVTSQAAGSTSVSASTQGFSSQSEINITAGGSGQTGDPCSLEADICKPSDDFCDIDNGYSCNLSTCTCVKSGLQCDSDTSTLICDPSNSICASGAACNLSTCYCEQPQLSISGVSQATCGEPSLSYLINQTADINFYVDGNLISTITGQAASSSEYVFQFPSGSMMPGSHILSAQATNANGSSSDSVSYLNDCYDAPQILSHTPAAENLQCSNSSFAIMYDQPMLTSGVADYFSLLHLGSSLPFSLNYYNLNNGVDGCVSATSDKCTVFVLNPHSPLPYGKIELEIKAGIKSVYGVGVSGATVFGYCTDCAQPVASICSLDGVEIAPPVWFATAVGSTENFLEREFAYAGSETVYITPVDGYSWQVNWSENDPANLITYTSSANVASVSVPSAGQGQSFITAQAEITEDSIFGGDHLGRKRSGTAAINIFVCEYPWPDPPPYNIDASGVYLNADMYYCRGNNPQDLLPDLVNEVNLLAGVSAGDLVKDSIFTVGGTSGNISGSDIIGLRVYKNPSHASAEGWYNSQGFPQGSPQSTIIDGYPAVVDGRTTYIHFVDVPDKTAISYILVLSHNQQPTPQTLAIYKNILKNLKFNLNLDYTQKFSLQEDMERIGGLGAIVALINKYGENPQLESGTYIKGMSTSRWPSWQAVLGNTLGRSLPLDPDNSFGDCPVEQGYDASSCFNTNLNPKFYCSEGSHIYIYKDTGQFYTNLKYKGIDWQGVGGSNDDGCYSMSITTEVSGAAFKPN